MAKQVITITQHCRIPKASTAIRRHGLFEVIWLDDGYHKCRPTLTRYRYSVIGGYDWNVQQNPDSLLSCARSFASLGMTIITGPGFRGATQRACVRAADRHLYASDRTRVLELIATSPHTEPEALGHARRLLER